MRNLKRALSLGLTAAMISGLMVMGSSAVSYPDSDQIQNQTAVEILGEIGVMVGDDNGNFNPTQDVTRAEMAVIITRILYGNDLNVDQFKGMNLFTDVPAWAEGFVNLCASLDIVAGVGDGKFAPNETVTAAQAALMLSRALGYFQNNAEFGNDWALAAIRRATSAGIIGDDMVLAANEGLSRDNVAQMTFNTLTKAVPVQYNELLNVYYNENQGITYALTFNYLQTLGYTNFDLVYDNGDTTIYGRPATTWGIGTYRTTTSDNNSGTRYDEVLDADGGLMSSKVQILSRDEIITIENEPTYVYTDGTAEEDIYDDLGDARCNDQRGQKAEDEYDWTVYVNGEEVAADDVVIPTRNEGDDYAYTGEGVQTEIYVDDGDKTVTVVEINYYLAQVSSVNETEGTVSIRTISDLKADKAELDDRTFATTEFAKGDYVVFTIDQNADDDFYICEMTAPETVDGTVTRVNKNNTSDNSYLFLDRETRYDYSDHMAYDLNDETVVQHPSLEEDYTLFLDPNGYVLAYSGDTTKSFLYVQDSDEELADWEARVVLADGTDDVIMVDDDLKDEDATAINPLIAQDDDIDWLSFGDDNAAFQEFKAEMFGGNGYWPDADELNTNWSEARSKISEIDYQIWEYETNSDGDLYTLTGRNTRYATGVEINNGENHIDFIEDQWGRSKVSIDDDTIFVDVENNAVYTGRDEVPDVSSADIAYVVEGDHTRDVAEIVYIINGEIYDADATFFVLTSEKRDTEKYDGDLYFEFDDTYVDGHDRDGLYISYDALIEAGIDSLDEDDEDADRARDVAAEIKDELVGKIIEVRKSTDGTYVTEIRVHDTWDPAITATRSVLDVAEAWPTAESFDDWDITKYNTDSAETTYVIIEEQYNRALTEFTGYDVSEGGYGDIIEWVDEVPTTEDGYATLVNVVKTNDDDALLVYILRFNPEFYTHDIDIEINGVPVSDEVEIPDHLVFDAIDLNNYLDDLKADGYEEFSYYINGEAMELPSVVVTGYMWILPYIYEDVTINIVAVDEDILTNGRVTLDTTYAENADPNDVSLDFFGGIDYSFKYTGEGNQVSYTVTLLRNGVKTGEEDVVAADVKNGLVYGETDAVAIDSDDLITVVISDLVEYTPETKDVTLNFYDGETLVATDTLTVPYGDNNVNTSKIEVPEGYELVWTGDLQIVNGSVKVEIRPVVEKVRMVFLNFYDEVNRVQVKEETIEVPVDAIHVNTGDIKDMLPTGYEFVEVGDLAINSDGWVYVGVKPVQP